MRKEGLEPLTDREVQVLSLLEKGFTNKEVANELRITVGTVKIHVNNIYRKLRVDNRRAALSLAGALGLLTASQDLAAATSPEVARGDIKSE